MTRTAPRPGARPDRDVATRARIRGCLAGNGGAIGSVSTSPRCIARASWPTVFPPCPPSPSPALSSRATSPRCAGVAGSGPAPPLSLPRDARSSCYFLGGARSHRGRAEPPPPLPPSLVSLDRRRPDPSPISSPPLPPSSVPSDRARRPPPRGLVPPLPRDPPDPVAARSFAPRGGGRRRRRRRLLRLQHRRRLPRLAPPRGVQAERRLLQLERRGREAGGGGQVLQAREEEFRVQGLRRRFRRELLLEVSAPRR